MNQPDRRALSVALVVPTYNRADLIGETLRSALAQSRPFDQIIVVDNGSTDDTGDVVRAFGPAVEYVRTANVGVQAARNIGVDRASTELVVLCDSDDLLELNYLDEVLALWSRSPALKASYSNFVNFGAGINLGRDKFSQAPPGWLSELQDRGDHWLGDASLYGATIRFQPLFPSGMCVRRERYLAIGGFDTALRGVGAEDWEFTLRACAEGHVAMLKAPLVKIRRHQGNDSASALHMNLGEAQVLRHALAHHPVAARWREPIVQSIDERLHRAFDAAFAQGDFAQAIDIVRACTRPPAGARAWLKRNICQFPSGLRQQAWRIVQGTSRAPQAVSRVTVVEPAWDQIAHLPGNMGLLHTVAKAYPEAKLHFVGGADQIVALRPLLPVDLLGRLTFTAWRTAADVHPGWQAQRAARARWRALPRTATEGADLIVLCSLTATALTELARAGLAHRSCAMLHGNANEVAGWRSRNPLSRHFDLTAAMRRYCASGGRISVLEDRIVTALQARVAWLQGCMLCLPHPLPPEEARGTPPALEPGRPVRVGFLGMATKAKGFLEFLELAKLLHQAAPGRFEFHAVGMIHPTLKDIDQSALATPAADVLDRKNYIQAMRKLDWGFAWHHDDYYAEAASGVVYDAVNQLLPLVTRDGAQLAAWLEQGLRVGMAYGDVAAVARGLAQTPHAELLAKHQQAVADLLKLRASLDLPLLAADLRQKLGSLRPSVS